MVKEYLAWLVSSFSFNDNDGSGVAGGGDGRSHNIFCRHRRIGRIVGREQQ